MNIVSFDDSQVIDLAVETLKNGGILIFPTETAYGVGVDATNSDAVAKLLKYKKRPSGKAISIGVNSKQMASEYVEINKEADDLFEKFLPGALTIISQSKGKVDKRLESENGTLGIRIPNYKLFLEIVQEFGKPITTTSANSSGKKTPYSINDILEYLSDDQKSLISLIINGGELPHNPPSTVIDTTTQDLKVFRQGRIDPLSMELVFEETSNSVEETMQLAEKFMSKIKQSGNNLILLNGELGAGKTHFTKGIGKSLGIKDVIKSPTYTYVSEYEIPNSKFQIRKLYHFDAWRISTKDDLQALRFYSWFSKSTLVVVEWPSVVMNLDEDFFTKINYYYCDFIIKDENSRIIRVYKKTTGL